MSLAQYNSGKSSKSGFTLIEVIIAIMLLAIIMTVTYSSLSGILRTKKVLDQRHDTSSVANALLTRMSREIQLASSVKLLPSKKSPNQPYPANVYLEGNQEDLGEGRRGDTITFMANEGGQYLPDGGTHTGFVQITYRVEKDPEDRSDNAPYYLIREETPEASRKLPANEIYSKSMVFPVTKLINSLEFRYFDPDQKEWSSSWNNQRQELPALVEFTVKLQSGDGQVESFTSAVPTTRR